MVKFRIYLFVALISLLAFSCVPCMFLDCQSSRYYGQFRIISAADGTDLVFGPGSIYDKDSIRFYSVSGVDTTLYDYQTSYFPNTGYDSILYVQFYPKVDIVYMRLNNSDIDTLRISYNEYESKCCGHITEITGYRFNNLIDIPGDIGTVEIKK